MLALADCSNCGFPLWSRAAATGPDLLWRFTKNMKFPVVEALDDGSWRSMIRDSGRDTQSFDVPDPVIRDGSVRLKGIGRFHLQSALTGRRSGGRRAPFPGRRRGPHHAGRR
ncbi:MAG: hypothetical protein OXH79_13045 [Boseongicola sp.]|nr:hypothetical protein [Boseongicola sp.]